MFNSLKHEIANLEKVVRDPRHEHAVANQREESLNETINSLRAQDKISSPSTLYPTSHILTCFQSSEEKIVNLEKVVRELRQELATSQWAANQKEKSLNESNDSLRAQDEKSSTSNGILTSVIGIDVHQTTKSYNYNKKRTTSHKSFVSTNRSISVKIFMPRAAYSMLSHLCPRSRIPQVRRSEATRS